MSLKSILLSLENRVSVILFKIRPLKRRPILLLAHDRSGSTWLGRTLGKAPESIYLHEPINPEISRLGTWELYNIYVAKNDSAPDFRKIFDKACQCYGVRELTREELRLRLFGNPHVIIKETGGMMNGEWFSRIYNARILLLVRHPAPLILSNIEMGPQNADKWLTCLLKQKQLREEHLQSINVDLETYQNDDLITKFAVIYAIRYRVALNQLERNPDWLFLKYEDFCVDPISRFENLYSNLGLSFTMNVRKAVENESTTDGSKAFFGTRRVSKSNLTKWFNKCGEDDRARIRNVLEKFRLPLYHSDSDWTPRACL